MRGDPGAHARSAGCGQGRRGPGDVIRYRERRCPPQEKSAGILDHPHIFPGSLHGQLQVLGRVLVRRSDTVRDRVDQKDPAVLEDTADRIFPTRWGKFLDLLAHILNGFLRHSLVGAHENGRRIHAVLRFVNEIGRQENGVGGCVGDYERVRRPQAGNALHAEAGDESLRDDDGGAPRARDERDRADGLRSERQCGDEGGPVRTEHLLDSQPPRDVCDGRVEACGVVGAGRRGEDEALDARRDGRAADLHGDG